MLGTTDARSFAADVVVAGGGAAGISAAIAAARKGAKVALLERTESVGGIVGHGLIHTIGGLYDSSGSVINGGLPAELIQRLQAADSSTAKRRIGKVWVLSACPSVYRRTVEAWLAAEPEISVYLGVDSLKVETADDRIGVVTFRCQGKSVQSRVEHLLDCTGDGNVIESIDCELVEKQPAAADALAGLIFRMRNVERKHLEFPRSIAIHRSISEAVLKGLLPSECSHVWIDRGVYEDEVYVKMSMSGGQRANGLVQQRIDFAKDALIAFLKQHSAFAGAVLVDIGRLSFRGGAQVKGEYVLTAADVRTLRRFPDAACRCAWPIEYWNPSKGVELEYLKDDGGYDIPLGALKVARLANAWTAGKCLSAEPLAQASARVSGCCWAMGQAVGNAITR